MISVLPEDLELCSRLSKLNRVSVDIIFDIADGTLPAETAALLAAELTDLGREFGRRAKRHTIQSQPTVIDTESADPEVQRQPSRSEVE